MSKKPLTNIMVSFASINLTSGFLAILGSDWFGLYSLFLSGPFSTYFLNRMVVQDLADIWFLRSYCLIIAIVFSIICSFWPKIWMSGVAGVAWVAIGFIKAGAKGIFA